MPIYTQRFCSKRITATGDTVLFVVDAIPHVSVLRDLWIVVHVLPGAGTHQGDEILEHQADGFENVFVSGHQNRYWQSGGQFHWTGRQRMSEGASWILRRIPGADYDVSVWATGYVFPS